MKSNRKTINLRRKESTSNIQHLSTIASQRNKFTYLLSASTRNVNKHGRHQHSPINIRQLSAIKNTIPHNQRLQIIAETEWKRGQNVGRTSIPSHSSVATADFRHRRSAKTAAPYDSVRRHRKRNDAHAKRRHRNGDSHSVLSTLVRIRQTMSK